MGDLANVKQEVTALSEKNIEFLSGLIANTKFGSVTIVIQDGLIVQIEKNEKIRIK